MIAPSRGSGGCTAASGMIGDLANASNVIK